MLTMKMEGYADDGVLIIGCEFEDEGAKDEKT